MLFLIEFGKVFRRKFNYLFGILTLLIGIIFTYKLGSLVTYFDISRSNIIFDFILKIILGLTIFIMGINYIYSYREDYNSRVSTLLEVKKLKTVRDFSAIFANVLYFFFYCMVILLGIFSFLFLRERSTFIEIKDVILSENHIFSYTIFLVLLLLFSNLIFLLLLTLFNNTNLAISLSLLYFIGGSVIAKMLVNRFSIMAERIDNSILTVFDKSFNNLNQFIEFNGSMFIPLVLNIVGLVVVIFIVKFIKKVIN
ncbi:hypothetical protein [Gemella cuniculi]|uniref:hypothetical protein n=1 Tax=Gemella cuniculi TaxID=150240 RepID=UPI000401E917|nr:hypothetical protein [Gemella cuniculi]